MSDNNKTMSEFLRNIRSKKKKVNVFLTSGIKLVGVIHSFDDRSFVIRGDSDMLVMLSSVSTVVPASASYVMSGRDERGVDIQSGEEDDGWRA